MSLITQATRLMNLTDETCNQCRWLDDITPDLCIHTYEGPEGRGIFELGLGHTYDVLADSGKTCIAVSKLQWEKRSQNRGIGDGVGGFEAVAGSITATRTSYHSATVKDAGRPHSQNVGATQKG